MSDDRLRSLEDLRPQAAEVTADRALLGEMTHGTAEFYEARAELTLALAEEGFQVVALEADWPDAAVVDAYVRGRHHHLESWLHYARWPTWMWRNRQFLSFIQRLRAWNQARPQAERVQVVGLDLYSMPESIAAVLAFLDGHDSALAAVARRRYACLAQWQDDPAHYGAGLLRGLDDCRDEVMAVLEDLLRQRLDGLDLFDAQQNARTVAGAEAYYRSLYDARASSWDLRDTHMADTLDAVCGDGKRAVVWAHNSHVGDARAMEGHEVTLGTLCRQRHETWSLGAFTHEGTVTAGRAWDAPVETVPVRPSRPDSHGHWLCDFDDGIVPLADVDMPPRLERAIGVVYRPESERVSHHFVSTLQDRYDAVLWLHTTRATQPLATRMVPGTPETWPSTV